ncbi:MAG TPA: VanZ family protein [Candidatus Limnocylindrales bacterium]
MAQWLRVWLWTLALLPVGVLAAVVLTRVRPSRSWRRSATEVGMVYGTLPWAWMILTPVKVPPDTKMTHWVPLEDVLSLLKTDLWWVQIGGNLGVFLVLGALAPMRWAALARPWRLLALGAASSLILEILQRLLAGGRVFSVDDVLLNAIGCLLGGILTRRWWLRS